jgi:hypothetical protein
MHLECSAWVDGDKVELDSVAFVRYRLDPTLPNSIRDVRDSETAFRTSFKTMIGFPFTAEVHFRDASVRRLSGAVLSPRRQSTGRTIAPRRVFISHSAADTKIARAIADEMQQQGFDARTSSEMAALAGWTVALHRYLQRHGAMIVLVMNAVTPIMSQEIQVADDLHAPTAVLIYAAVQDAGALKKRFTVSFASVNPRDWRDAVSVISKHFQESLPLGATADV